ncbi:MAG: hypothetical protein ACRDLR_01080, partial [Gaiellaceae bacterium]
MTPSGTRFSDDSLISTTELAVMFDVYEGPAHPVARPQARQRRRLTVVLAGFVITAFALGGIAAAAGLGPFGGIGAADHPVANSDVLPPEITAKIEQLNAGPEGDTAAGQLIPHTARLITTLDSGRRIYVIATSTGDFCVLDQDAASQNSDWGFGCSQPLSDGQPTTIGTIQKNAQTPPLSFGVAQDNVAAVSFEAAGAVQTIPVTNNVWVYEGASNALRSLTVHLRDGSTMVIDHG